MKKVLLATLLAMSTMAWADEHEAKAVEDTSGSWSASVTATSEYLFRGLKQTQGDPALQGQLDYDFGNGFYVGAWASYIKWTDEGNYMNNNDVETNIWVGYADKIGDTGFGYDVGVLQYWYPGTVKNGVADTDATEAYIGLDKDLGSTNLAVKYSQVLSDDAWGIADAKDSQYWEANWTVPVADSWTAVAHIGRSEFDNNSSLDYTDYKASLEHAWNDNLTIGAGYSWTNASDSSWTIQGERQGESQALGWVTWTF